MKISTALRTCAAAAMLVAADAQACEFTYDETWKIWRGDCRLTIDPKGPMVRNEIVVARTTLKLPDLTIDKLKFYLRGNQLEVHADVENIGTQNSPDTTVVLNLTLVGPSGTNMVAIGPGTVPILAPAAKQRVMVGTVTVDNSAGDVDVTVTGMVDPPTMTQPVRGKVFEQIESNNEVMHLCRVYGGPNPNTALQACN